MRTVWILSAVIAMLLASLGASLMAVGQRDAIIKARDERIGLMTRERQAAERLTGLLGERDATVATEAARACGIEGNDAFTRGVAVGRAVCAARAPR